MSSENVDTQTVADRLLRPTGIMAEDIPTGWFAQFLPTALEMRNRRAIADCRRFASRTDAAALWYGRWCARAGNHTSASPYGFYRRLLREALRRLGDAARSRFGRSHMRSSVRPFPWIIVTIGATSWFALWAVYSQLVLA